MATITSRLPPLLDYLVALFTSAATLGQAPAPGTVTVFDGPATTELDPALCLWVGLPDPDNPAAETAADFTQTWAALGRLGRDETITIHCCAQAWSGVDDVRTVRVAAIRHRDRGRAADAGRHHPVRRARPVPGARPRPRVAQPEQHAAGLPSPASRST